MTVELFFAGSFILAGLAATAVFVHVFAGRPAGTERHKMLCNSATAAVLFLSSGSVVLVDVLLPALSAGIIRVAVMVVLGQMMGAMVFLAWVNFRVPARRPSGPDVDFKEDAAGNSVRAGSGEQRHRR